MRLGARYEEKKSQQEHQITPSIFPNTGPSFVFEAYNIGDDNLTL